MIKKSILGVIAVSMIAISGAFAEDTGTAPGGANKANERFDLGIQLPVVGGGFTMSTDAFRKEQADAAAAQGAPAQQQGMPAQQGM